MEPGRGGARTGAAGGVKARVVKLTLNMERRAAGSSSAAKAVDAHLRYIERDGVTRTGGKGSLFGRARW